MTDVTDFRFLTDAAFAKNRISFADNTKVHFFADDSNQAADSDRPMAMNLAELVALCADGNSQTTFGNNAPTGGDDLDVHIQHRLSDNNLLFWKKAAGNWNTNLTVQLGDLNTTNLLFEAHPTAGVSPPAPATWTHAIVWLPDNSVEYWTSNGTIGALQRTIPAASGGTPTNITAGEFAPSGGNDGDAHFQLITANNQMIIHKKISGTWTPLLTVPLGEINSEMLFDPRPDNTSKGTPPAAAANTWTHAIVTFPDSTIDFYQSDGTTKTFITRVIDNVGSGGQTTNVTSSAIFKNPSDSGNEGDVHFFYDAPQSRIRVQKYESGLWYVMQDIPMNTNPITTASDSMPTGGLPNDVWFQYDAAQSRILIYKNDSGGGWVTMQIVPVGKINSDILYEDRPNSTPDIAPGSPAAWTHAIVKLNNDNVEYWTSDGTTATRFMTVVDKTLAGESIMLYEARLDAVPNVPPAAAANSWTHAIVKLTNNTLEFWESNGTNKTLTMTAIDQVGAGGTGSDVTAGTNPPDDVNGENGDAYFQYDLQNGKLVIFKKSAGSWAIIQNVDMHAHPRITTSSPPSFPTGSVDDFHISWNDTLKQLGFAKHNGTQFNPLLDINIPKGNSTLIYEDRGTTTEDQPPANPENWTHAIVFLANDIIEFWESNGMTASKTRRYAPSSGSTVLNAVVEGKLGTAPPTGQRCRYMVAPNSTAVPSLTFTPATGLYTLDVQDGFLMSADFWVPRGDIVNGAIDFQFTGTGFTGTVDTRYATRAEVAAQPDLNGVYSNAHAVVGTGPPWDRYNILGLINGAEYRVLIQF